MCRDRDSLHVSIYICGQVEFLGAFYCQSSCPQRHVVLTGRMLTPAGESDKKTDDVGGSVRMGRHRHTGPVFNRFLAHFAQLELVILVEGHEQGF